MALALLVIRLDGLRGSGLGKEHQNLRIGITHVMQILSVILFHALNAPSIQQVDTVTSYGMCM